MQDGFRNLEYTPPPYVSHPLIVKNEMLANDKAMTRSFIRAFLKGHLFFGQKPEETLNVIQKVLRIDDRKTARETYEDEMRRYNPGGGFEQATCERLSIGHGKREKRNVKWKFRMFLLSMAADLDGELKNGLETL